MKRKKKKWIFYGLLCVLCFILILMLIPLTRSFLFMKFYSKMEAKGNVLEESGLRIEMMGGRAWFPYVMTFQDDEGFSRWSGIPSRLTILYNFPAFDHPFGRTRGFDPHADYYNSAYAVRKMNGEPFGFLKDGEVNMDEVSLVPQFDFEKLVLEDFGLKQEDQFFSWTPQKITKQVSIAGFPGWTRIEADLSVNGMYHEKKGFVSSYIQYGSPKRQEEFEDFAVVQMKGLVYAKYFSDQDVSVFFYAMTPSEDTLLETEAQFLRTSFIHIVDFSE